MFELDKKKFGGFVSALRKEKGYTQKELAEKLFVSDKAVSKWETGVSIPDTALLIPLAELLGITVTELLMCQRREEDMPMAPSQVEGVVKTALSYSAPKAGRAFQVRSKWSLLYVCALIAGFASTLLGWHLGLRSATLPTGMILGAVFGGYFCFFVKTELPEIYDQKKIGLYYDGFFRMNLPGVAFNNANWPYIIRSGRIWACLTVSVYPLLCLAMYALNAGLWAQAELWVFLVLELGGLFVPMYLAAKKYG